PQGQVATGQTPRLFQPRQQQVLMYRHVRPTEELEGRVRAAHRAARFPRANRVHGTRPSPVAATMMVLTGFHGLLLSEPQSWLEDQPLAGWQGQHPNVPGSG